MKKIAKGVSLLLITLFLLMTIATICTATDEKSTESEASQANFNIDNYLDRDSVKIYVEDNVLYIENQSAKELGKVYIKITINDESFGEISGKIPGFSTYSLKLTDYFSEEYINGKDVNIFVNKNADQIFSIIMFMALCAVLIAVLIIAIIYFRHH